ncbi:hypothetical protein Aasi_1868 [Candidatus Amoebophilus asiaticus 5a2]|uniref:F-box domain-containing protein n=2 Tax=Candidatus Amoebophilus asiaticus TaxID=281120 RepID=C3L463_AMOA5|nr:hypothetical protein Aasi_1868 [Candidatus Amoebophilus asiaticus 5a2]
MNKNYYASLLNKNMKKHCSLPLLQVACFVLISLLLQNCGGSHNLPIQGEEEPSTSTTIEKEEGQEQGRRKSAKIEIGEEQEQRLIEQVQETSSFDIFPSEICQYIFSYLKFEDILPARAVNSDWSELITGFRQAGIVGVENKPSHIIDTRGWNKKKEINFHCDKLRVIKPETIPSFAFYCLMGSVRNLPQTFWPHLQGTNVHTILLNQNQLGPIDTVKFIKHLQRTSIHTIDLNNNRIGTKGAIELAKNLQGTNVEIVYLKGNQIEDAGVMEFARNLQSTNVHTVYLRGNKITSRTTKLLKEQYPHIKW